MFSLQIAHVVLLERNRRTATLLRAVVHQSVLADVEIATSRPAVPVVGGSGNQVLLKLLVEVETGK